MVCCSFGGHSTLQFLQCTSPSSFKAGTGWLKRFKDRYGIHALSIPGESLSAATEGTDCFKDRLSKIIEEKCLTLN